LRRPGRCKGAHTWQVWADLLLAHEAHTRRPWEAAKEPGGVAKAWDALAAKLEDADKRFQHSGISCKARFRKLTKDFKV
jgi:hypothetical protein